MVSKKSPVASSKGTKPIIPTQNADLAKHRYHPGVTGRKRAESALQDTQEFTENLIETSKTKKEKRAAELVIANKELVFQNKEKAKRAAELVIANEELVFQNKEKAKRAAELVIANEELVFQNKEKAKRAAELVSVNKELAFQIDELKSTKEQMESLASFPSENPNPVLRISRKGILRYTNEAALRLMDSWKLKVGRSAPKVLRDLVTEVLQKRAIKTIDIPCGERTFSIAVAPSQQDTHVNLYARDISQRLRAEEALQASGLRSRQLLDAMLEGCQIISFDWRYLYVNDAAIQHGRQAKESLLGHTMMEVYPGIENTELFSVLRRCMNEHTPMQMENEFNYPDGKQGWFELSIQPVPEGIFILSIDITKRKQADEIILNLARFTLGNPNPVMRIASDGSLLYVNQSALKLLKKWNLRMGKAVPDVLKDLTNEVLKTEKTKTVDIPSGKRTFSIAIAPSRDDMSANLYARDVTERVQAEQEIRKLNADLEQRVTERTAQLQTANNRLKKELVERKRAEGALLESEERFRRLSEAAFEAIVIHDNGIVMNANTQYCRMFGYELEELLGKQVIPLTVAPEGIKAMRKEIAKGSAGPYESSGLRKDGTRFPMEIRVREIEYEGHKVRVAAIIDISKRKQAEQALQQRTVQLVAANKELEAFSYSISHDLRSPLRAMDGFSRILLEEYNSQLPLEAQHYLGLVRSNAQQMGRLIEDLLAFSRLSHLPLNKQTVAPAEIVSQVLADLRAEQEQRIVEVTIGELPSCEADPTLLKQVWVNLLTNAFKFTRKREKACIEIGVTHSNTKCIYFVKDNGVGFDMQYANKLFGVFQRLHRAEDYEGTGVGLAIVQRIVHRHGGRAWAEAEVDKGAAFYFTLGGGT